jgi:hypothetical protein
MHYCWQSSKRPSSRKTSEPLFSKFGSVCLLHYKTEIELWELLWRSTSPTHIRDRGIRSDKRLVCQFFYLDTHLRLISPKSFRLF